jgi:DNA polymerase-3 subunit delta
VIVQEKADKRSKLYKAIIKIGRAVLFQEQSEQTLIPWISRELGRENQKITGATASYLIQKVGVNMENLSSELQKLSSYCMGRSEVTRKDVDAICITNPENRIFNMMDAIADKEQKKAMWYYQQMVELKEPPMKILFMLTRQFNILLQVHELTVKGYSPILISKKLGIRDFVAKRCAKQVRGFTGEQLKKAVEDCVQANEDIKAGNLPDRIAIELIIVRYSTK